MHEVERGGVAASPVPGLFADPALVVINGRYWLYPTTDGLPEWAARSFTALSSPDLRNWTDHGQILRLGSDVAWCDRKAWAPAVAERDGEFFLYFTAGGGNIGVAKARHPAGPFVDLGRPLVAEGDYSGVAIDPSVFRDADGTWYLLWGNGTAHIAPLGDDMMSFDAREVFDWVPADFREAITIHRRGHRYYASWSENDTRDPDYRVRYATAPSARGPWADRGVLIEQDPSMGYFATGHHSITQLPGRDEWIVAYHRFAVDGGDGCRREVVFDRLIHREDGTLAVPKDPRGIEAPLARATPLIHG